MNRRTFFRTTASGLLVPLALRAEEQQERNFIFVFADGGWDPCTVFAPLFDNPHADLLPDSDRMDIGGFSLVGSPMRPSVQTFFERYGSETVVFNGLDLQTVSHERGKQIVMTGSTQGEEDWGAHIAHFSQHDNAHMVVSGPSFSTYYPDSVLRVGKRGQLKNLLMANDQASQQMNRLGEEYVEQYLLEQAQKHLQRFTDPFSAHFAETHHKSLNRQRRILEEGPNINFDIDTNNVYGNCNDSFMFDLEVALSAMEAGLLRSTIVEDYGYCGWRWDTHYDLVEQSYHFELLFSGLIDLLVQLETRSDPMGVRLIDKTTVVVLSEMGRHPKLNYIGGKDHWPVTSLMMIGGVKGGRTIGAFSDDVISSPIDPQSGELFDKGEKLIAKHIGSTLLALADIDPASVFDVSPIYDILP